MSIWNFFKRSSKYEGVAVSLISPLVSSSLDSSGYREKTAKDLEKELPEVEEALQTAEENRRSNHQSSPVTASLNEGKKHVEATIPLYELKKQAQAHRNDLLEAEVGRLKADNSNRNKMFNWAILLISMMIMSTIMFLFIYMVFAMFVLKQLPEKELLIAWMGTTVVEAIGIVLIIARYLFPQQVKETDSS